MKKNIFFKFIISTSIVIISIFCFSVNGFSADKTPEKESTIAILPFEIISPENISYIQSGIVQMLHSRLFWRDHVNIVENHIITATLNDIKSEDKNLIVQKIADLTKSDYVLTGTITQFSNAFSIDTKIYDIKNQQFLPFFEQSKIIDDVIPKLNVITAKINKKVFERETIIYARLAKEEKERIEKWKRQSPERMMPEIPKTDPEDKSSIWKFWQYL